MLKKHENYCVTEQNVLSVRIFITITATAYCKNMCERVVITISKKIPFSLILSCTISAQFQMYNKLFHLEYTVQEKFICSHHTFWTSENVSERSINLLCNHKCDVLVHVKLIHTINTQVRKDANIISVKTVTLKWFLTREWTLYRLNNTKKQRTFENKEFSDISLMLGD